MTRSTHFVAAVLVALFLAAPALADGIPPMTGNVDRLDGRVEAALRDIQCLPPIIWLTQRDRYIPPIVYAVGDDLRTLATACERKAPTLAQELRSLASEAAQAARDYAAARTVGHAVLALERMERAIPRMRQAAGSALRL